MELNDLILLAAAALYREGDGVSTFGGRIPVPDPFTVAVKKAKKLWKAVIAEEKND